LERWHNLGRGLRVVLDLVPESGVPNYDGRRAMLESPLSTNAVFSGEKSRAVRGGTVVLTPTVRVDSIADALAFSQRMREADRALRCHLFDGVVRKLAESIYPVRLRSAKDRCRGWVTHRRLG
jgi:hypothetical protein